MDTATKARRFGSGCTVDEAKVAKLPAWARGLIHTMDMRITEASDAYERLAGQPTSIEVGRYSSDRFNIDDRTEVSFTLDNGAKVAAYLSDGGKALTVRGDFAGLMVQPEASNSIRVTAAAR